jgi:hypothetical protein
MEGIGECSTSGCSSRPPPIEGSCNVHAHALLPVAQFTGSLV